MMNRIILLIMLMGIHFSMFAQGDKNQATVVKNGIKYYVHVVQGGNTLYGLSRTYSVPIQDIIQLNPETEKGLVEGQNVLIPIAGKEAAPATTPKADNTKPTSTPPPTTGANSGPNTFAKTHVVERSETMYSISKKYGITIEQLASVNPGIEKGIQVDQVLILPAAANSSLKSAPSNIQVVLKDSVIQYTVIDKETLYSLSKRYLVTVEEIKAANKMTSNSIKKGDVIKIPLKREKVTHINIKEVSKLSKELIDQELLFKQKDHYKIVLLLPFSLDKTKDPYQGIATEFLMGAQLAFDSLANLGLKASVQVLDTPNDSIKLKALLNGADFKNVDLVVGPFLGENLEITARWCEKNQVRFVNPILGSTQVLKGNPLTFNAVTSDVTLMHGSANYIYKTFPGQQVILVKVSSKDEELYQAFRQSFLALSFNGNKQKLIEVDAENINSYLQKKLNTVIVYPTRDKVLAMKFMNNLQKNYGNNDGLTLFATKEWYSFNDIKGFYKNKYNLHYASSNDFNYSYAGVKELAKKYRVAYNADLTKFAAQGFDVCFYFTSVLLRNKAVSEGVMNKIHMSSTGAGNGYQNNTCFILKHEDYEYIKVGEYIEK